MFGVGLEASLVAARFESPEAIFAPVSIPEFVEQYLERAVLHVPRDRAGYFDAIFTVEHIERALVEGAREPERFSLVKAAAPPLPQDQFTLLRPLIRGRSIGKTPVTALDVRKVLDWFDKGYTLVIKDGSQLDAGLQHHCNEIQRKLGIYAQTNIYFTPPNAQGFEVHHDTHDTLTIQIEGIKTWLIYDPVVELPLEAQPFPTGGRVRGLNLRRQVTLRPGDTLYIPRGHPHEAVEVTGGRSLHVTFALAPVRTLDLLEDVLRVMANGDVPLRRGLEPGWQNDPAFPARFAQSIIAYLAAALTPDHVALARENALYDQFACSRADLDGAFAQAAKLAGLGADSVVRVNPEVPFLFREREDSIHLFVCGKALVLPKPCAPAIARLLQGPARLGELDSALTENTRKELVRMLAIEGVLLIE